MPKKDVILPKVLLNAGDMTGDLTSTQLAVQYFNNVGLEITWTGTPTGTIAVNGSNSGTTFYALTFSPVLTQPAGSAGGYLIDLNQFPFAYFNVTYTHSSGTGTLTVTSMVKEF